MPWREPLRLLLTNRRFLALWGSDFVATVGDRIHRVALAALVYDVTGSMTVAGLAFLASGLPDLLLGPLAGAVVDRFDRRWIMISSDLVRVVPVLLLPFAGWYALTLIYPLLFFINAAAIFHRPAKMAAIPTVVPRAQLTTANSLSSLAESLGDIGGYPVAGVAVGTFVTLFGSRQGLALAFFLAAVGYLGSAALLWPLRLPSPLTGGSTGEHRAGVIVADLRQGVSFLLRNPLVRTNTMIVTLGAAAVGLAMPLLVGYAYERAGSGEVAYSLLNFGIGVGSILGAALMSAIAVRRLGSLVLVGLGLMALGLAGLGLQLPLWVGVGLTALTGLGNMLFLIPSVTIVQRATPAYLMGRIFSLRSTTLFTVLLVANGLGGWLGDAIGAAQSFLWVGVGLFAATLVAMAMPATWLADCLDDPRLELTS